MAFLPARWECPEVVTPGWLANQPLILNDTSTRLSRLTSEWFASDARQPTPRIQLNYNDAIKSLVAAGYGATLLPHEASTPLTDSQNDHAATAALAVAPAWVSRTGMATWSGLRSMCWTCCGG